MAARKIDGPGVELDGRLSFDERVELIKHLGDLRMQYLKCFNDRRPIIQQYVEGILQIHIHLTNREGIGTCLRYRDESGRSGDTGADEFAVFIDVGESVEKLERREAIVRLEPLNDCDLFVAEKLEITGPILLKELWGRVDRKLCSVLLGTSVDSCESEDHVVEGRPGMVDVFADKAQSLIVDDVLKIEKNLRTIRLTLTSSHIKCVLGDLLNHEFQLIELFPCPTYPEFGLVKRVSHD